jgi:hypothetical protein
MKRFLSYVMIMLTALWLGGCGGEGLPRRVKVKGKVSYRGQPLSTGTLNFSPKVKESARPATGYLLEDGSFEMTTYRPGDGVQPGEYDVAIISYDEGPLSNSKNWTRKGKKLIPEKYFKYATSGLQASVPDHDIELEFNLE